MDEPDPAENGEGEVEVGETAPCDCLLLPGTDGSGGSVLGGDAGV